MLKKTLHRLIEFLIEISSYEHRIPINKALSIKKNYTPIKLRADIFIPLHEECQKPFSYTLGSEDRKRKLHMELISQMETKDLITYKRYESPYPDSFILSAEIMALK